MRLGLATALMSLACSSSDDGGSDDGSQTTGAKGATSTPDSGSNEPTVPAPPAEFIPSPTGACPAFQEGSGCTNDGTSLVCDFAPAGVNARKARVWLGDQAFEKDGPIVIFFHGWGGNGGNAVQAGAGLGPMGEVPQQIIDAGGILVGMEKDDALVAASGNGFPWVAAVAPGDDTDFIAMDEVVACAIQEVGIDLSRIHVAGFSAGGLNTGTAIQRRSGYVASVAIFSGGKPAQHEVQDPSNKMPVMMMNGGPNDYVILYFKDQEELLRQELTDNGQFSFICDHGLNHTVPPEGPSTAWQFFQDHPYGTFDSPYADGLPASFPDYCTL